MSRAGWLDDPTGRFRRRYHDGSAWTGHVQGEDGVQAEDPLPFQPAPPARASGAEGGGVQFGALLRTKGAVVALGAGVIVLLSLFVLDFGKVAVPTDSFSSLTLSAKLGEYGNIAPELVSAFGGPVSVAGLGKSYASVGRLLGVVLVVLGVVAATRRAEWIERLANRQAVVVGVLSAWSLFHLMGMFSADLEILGESQGFELSPTFGAWLGLLGWVGLIAGQFLEQPLGTPEPPRAL